MTGDPYALALEAAAKIASDDAETCTRARRAAGSVGHEAGIIYAAAGEVAALRIASLIRKALQAHQAAS